MKPELDVFGKGLDMGSWVSCFCGEAGLRATGFNNLQGRRSNLTTAWRVWSLPRAQAPRPVCAFMGAFGAALGSAQRPGCAWLAPRK